MSHAFSSTPFFLVFGLLLIGACGKTADEGERAPKVELVAPPPPQKAQAPSIIFLGDSLTAGYGLDEAQAFPSLLEKRLGAHEEGYQVINAGRSGDTTAGGLARLDWYLKDRINPRALVIFLGSNDAIRGIPLATIEENLRAIVDKARSYRADLKIFLVELRTFPNMGVEYGEEFQELFARVASDKKATLIAFPLEKVAGRMELNQQDGVHPNERGTQMIAEHIWKSLEPAL